MPGDSLVTCFGGENNHQAHTVLSWDIGNTYSGYTVNTTPHLYAPITQIKD